MSLPALHGASAAILLFPTFAAGQQIETLTDGGTMRSLSLPPAYAFGTRGPETMIMQDAGPVWRRDSQRESREDRNYWMNYRGKLKARLLAAEQARTARIVTAARARAAALGAPALRSDTVTADGSAASATREVSFPQPAGMGALSGAAATAKRHLDRAVTTASNTTGSLANTIERTLSATKNPATRTASIILALLTVFLAPAILLTAVAFGFLRLRKRRR